jgi:hypothetical protein
MCRSASYYTCGLTGELEAAQPQLTNDITVPESCQAAHLRRDHDRVVSPFTGSRQVLNAVPLAASFDQFPSDVARDLQRFGNCPPLRYEAGKFIGGRQK